MTLAELLKARDGAAKYEEATAAALAKAQAAMSAATAKASETVSAAAAEADKAAVATLAASQQIFALLADKGPHIIIEDGTATIYQAQQIVGDSPGYKTSQPISGS